jgi:hypothetical protein
MLAPSGVGTLALSGVDVAAGPHGLILDLESRDEEVPPQATSHPRSPEGRGFEPILRVDSSLREDV